MYSYRVIVASIGVRPMPMPSWGKHLGCAWALGVMVEKTTKKHRQNYLEGSLKCSNSRPEQIKIEAAYLVL